jgi:hypothetical protein
MNFITTFARIAGYAAKAVFAVIYEMPNETATLDDLKAAGIKSSILYEALAELQFGGFIVKTRLGMYKVVDSAPPESNSAPPESDSSRNGGGGGGSKETHARTPARAVNVQNVPERTNKLTSTAEFLNFVRTIAKTNPAAYKTGCRDGQSKRAV